MKSLNNKKHFTTRTKKDKLFNSMDKTEELRYRSGFVNPLNQPSPDFFTYNNIR